MEHSINTIDQLELIGIYIKITSTVVEYTLFISESATSTQSFFWAINQVSVN